MNEFDYIAQFLKPLAANCDAGLSLDDDVALIPHTDSHDLVMTKDTIIEDVHFLANTPAKYIARKLLGVNLSDIASAGATPKYYMIAASLPRNIEEKWWRELTSELHLIQQEYAIHLIGGDTTSHDGKVILSATLIGEVAKNQALLRCNAEIGDAIYVSGTIGDGYLGLSEQSNKYLIDRYQSPSPRIKLGQKLLGIASSATDISDGLVVDLQNICQASNVGAQIFTDKIPISDAAKQTNCNITELITGGDDYELIFTVAQDKKSIIQNIAKEIDLQVTEIGNIVKNNSHDKEQSSTVSIYDNCNDMLEIKLQRGGYSH